MIPNAWGHNCPIPVAPDEPREALQSAAIRAKNKGELVAQV